MTEMPQPDQDKPELGHSRPFEADLPPPHASPIGRKAVTILASISQQVEVMVEPGTRLGFIQRPHVGLSYEAIDEATERVAQRMVALIEANPGLMDTLTGDAAIVQKVMDETRWDALSSHLPMRIALRRTGRILED